MAPVHFNRFYSPIEILGSPIERLKERAKFRPLFDLFSSFYTKKYKIDFDVSGIRAQIVIVEGEYTDH